MATAVAMTIIQTRTPANRAGCMTTRATARQNPVHAVCTTAAPRPNSSHAYVVAQM